MGISFNVHPFFSRTELQTTSGGSVGIGIFWGHFLPQQSGCGKKKKGPKNEVPLPKWSSPTWFQQEVGRWGDSSPLTVVGQRVGRWELQLPEIWRIYRPKMPLFWRDVPFSKLSSLGIYLKRCKVYSINGTCKIVIPRGCFSKTSFWGPMVHFPA